MARFLLSVLCAISFAVGAFLLFVKKDASFDGGVVAESPQQSILEENFPLKIGAASGRDLPLGNTEEVIRATEKGLNVSEYLNREYKLSDNEKFIIYISHWVPNKEPIRVASAHTPDRCWVGSGWVGDDSRKKEGVVLNTDSGKLFPASYREYVIGSMHSQYRRYVLFWFVAGGKIYDYATSDYFAPNPLLYVKNMIDDSLVGSPEMFFVRIDSDQPLENFYNNPDFKNILERLGKMVLLDNSKKGDSSNGLN